MLTPMYCTIHSDPPCVWHAGARTTRSNWEPTNLSFTLTCFTFTFLHLWFANATRKMAPLLPYNVLRFTFTCTSLHVETNVLHNPLRSTACLAHRCKDNVQQLTTNNPDFHVYVLFTCFYVYVFFALTCFFYVYVFYVCARSHFKAFAWHSARQLLIPFCENRYWETGTFTR